MAPTALEWCPDFLAGLLKPSTSLTPLPASSTPATTNVLIVPHLPHLGFSTFASCSFRCTPTPSLGLLWVPRPGEEAPSLWLQRTQSSFPRVFPTQNCKCSFIHWYPHWNTSSLWAGTPAGFPLHSLPQHNAKHIVSTWKVIEWKIKKPNSMDWENRSQTLKSTQPLIPN